MWQKTLDPASQSSTAKPYLDFHNQQANFAAESMSRRSIKVALVFVFAYFTKFDRSYASKDECASGEMSMGKRALVVGGTSGIGHGIALQLANRGVNVEIAGRSEARGADILGEMKKANPDGSFKFHKVDCFKLDDVKALADSQAKTKLDYLILTQGMATIQGFTPTEDGFDQKLQLHYYSRMLLANLLAPSMASSSSSDNPGRILSVLSAGVHSAYQGWDEDVALSEKSYSIKNAADSAGFYNDIGLDKLSKKHDNLIFSHACPGFVATNWGTEMPVWLRMPIRALQVFGKSKEDCGEFMVTGLLGPTKAGFYLLNEYGKQINRRLPEAETAKDKVWEHTMSALEKWLK